MILERKGAVKFKGAPLTVVGCELKPGIEAPAFRAHKALVVPKVPSEKMAYRVRRVFRAAACRGLSVVLVFRAVRASKEVA